MLWMKVLSNMFGKIGLGNVFDSVGTLVNETTPRDIGLNLKEIELKQIEAKVMQTQAEIDKIDATNEHSFNRSWRPFIGWVGGICLAFYYVPQIAIAHYIWLSNYLEHGDIIKFPMDDGQLMGLLAGLLGIGLFRTADKFLGK